MQRGYTDTRIQTRIAHRCVRRRIYAPDVDTDLLKDDPTTVAPTDFAPAPVTDDKIAPHNMLCSAGVLNTKEELRDIEATLMCVLARAHARVRTSPRAHTYIHTCIGCATCCGPSGDGRRQRSGNLGRAVASSQRDL